MKKLFKSEKNYLLYRKKFGNSQISYEFMCESPNTEFWYFGNNFTGNINNAKLYTASEAKLAESCARLKIYNTK